MIVGKKKRDSRVALEIVSGILDSARRIPEDLDSEINSITRFVREILGIFIADVRCLKDQLLLFAHRLAELEKMVSEKISSQAES